MSAAKSLANPIPPSYEFVCAENAALKEIIAGLRSDIAHLKHQLDWFKRQLFGRKSEQRSLAPDAAQMDFGEQFADPASALLPVPTEEILYTRRKARSPECVTDSGLRFDASVPVEVIAVPAPELSGPDAHEYEIISEKVTRRLAQRPGSYVVLEYRQPVVKHKPTETVTAPAAPAALFDQTIADVSFIAGLLLDKFLYHLPLYRQHQRLKDAGVELSRGTLTQYVQRASELLIPIYDAQLQHVLKGRVIAADETPIKAGRGDKGMRNTWFWPIFGEDDEICFTWADTRGSEHLQNVLQPFSGTLLSDGHTAYEKFAAAKPGITQAQCWVHARRYFERALDSEPAAAGQALDHIGALYRIEAEIRERKLQGEAKLDFRCRHSKPRVEAFFAWCYEQRQRMDIVRSEPLAKALTYVANRQAPLSVFLGDPELPMDTNHLERALRVIPMGRKNWLFCWTEVGARHVGIIQSLLSTCRLHGVDPYTYLVDVLQRVSVHPANRVEELTPRLWKGRFAGSPMRSDLDRAVKA